MVEPDTLKTDKSLRIEAYRKLEELIVTLKLAPGLVLSEADLMQMLDIGRTPVREAIQRLASEGLILVMPRRGIMVTEINPARQLQLLELRREVERLIVRDAAKKAIPEEQAKFAELAKELEAVSESGDDVAFMRLDLEFNRLTIKACRNEYAARSMQLMQGLSRRFWYQHYKESLDLRRCASLHMAVADAISRGQLQEAAAASDDLIDYLDEFTRTSI